MKSMHRALSLGLAVAGGLAAGGCEPPPPSQCQEEGFFDLVFLGEGFEARAGAMVPFRLARADDGFVEQSGAALIGADGTFEERISCGLEGAIAYELHWYVRGELGGDCDDANRAWLEPLYPSNQDLEVVATPDRSADPDGCAPF